MRWRGHPDTRGELARAVRRVWQRIAEQYPDQRLRLGIAVVGLLGDDRQCVAHPFRLRMILRLFPPPIDFFVRRKSAASPTFDTGSRVLQAHADMPQIEILNIPDIGSQPQSPCPSVNDLLPIRLN